MIPLSNLSQRAKLAVGGVVVLILFIGSIFFWLNSRPAKPDPAFSKYIESYTSGVISKESTIRIRLSDEVQTSHGVNERIPDGVFDFSPAVKGSAYWLDARTIEFRPAAKLQSSTAYAVTFNLGMLMEIEADYREFNFDFETIKPDFTINLEGLRTATNTSLDKMKLSGTLLTADAEDNAKVEEVLGATYDSKVRISWAHNGKARSHHFTVENISRALDKVSQLSLAWNGSPLNVNKSDSREFEVPAIGDFRVLDIRAVTDQEQYVQIYFSNPLLVGQEFAGLAGLENQPDMAFTIDGSTLKLYAPERLEGNFTAFVNPGIEDITHNKIKKAYTANLFFENRLPAVTIPGKGVILPGNGKLLMPFEAVNLNAVDVSIIKIYENNVPQYFQSNGFDDGNELRQVGKPVVQKTIRLDVDKSLNLGKKNRFMLDVDKLVRTEPGALYRVIIGFRNSYSTYNCSIAQASGDEEDDDYYDGDYSSNAGRANDEDDDFWERYDNFYPEGYRWEDRNNPCTESYYTKKRWATRNIIASNIGLIAKRGADNSMLVAVTNLIDAQPMSGTELELLDYQKQVIFKTRTDDAGIASFSLKRKPYLLVAKKGNERGYLKLDDGGSLPLSRFNVGGEVVQNGLKGFIYGERGVWRPGDSIFVTFVLEDKDNTLPKDHPVEFELFNPQGQLYKRLVRNKPVGGFYSFHTATTTGAPTGNWLVKVKAGGASFEKTLKVETVMPNRLKINLSFGNRDKLTKGTGAKGMLSAQWLFGGTAQSLKAKVDAFVSPQQTAFKNFEGYVFDDPTRGFGTQTQTVFDGRLSEGGTANINADINLDKQAPGQLRANFLVKVFEPGGNFSVNYTSMPYHVYQAYVGIKTPEGSALSGMLVTGKDHQIEIADVNTKGILLAGERDVEVQLFKVQWRWWWDQSGDELSNFTQDQYNKLVSTENVHLKNGRGRWTLRVKEADWGRYLIKVTDPQTGHSTGKIVYIDWPNWSERLQQENATEAAMLSFTSDKKAYKVGEEATLTIPTGAGGRALISYETGSKVLRTEWISTQKGQTRHRFTIDRTMAPNIFVNVTLLQPHAQTVNDLPIRMYGVIPLLVDDPATTLKPVITMAGKLKPETTSQVTISETSGKEMTYTLAIVDEGLLDLTNFKTPDPHPAFYAREALGVKTWDLFDYVLGAFGGGLERILSIGGDMEALNNKNPTVNRFKPVVKFLGPFHLKAGEKQTRRFRLPQYVGSVRVMVVAGHKGAYGFAEKAVAVKKPLMILATMPRVLGPGEKIQLPVNVFAMENDVRKVNVTVRSDMFTNLGGNNQKVVTFARPGDQIVSFDLAVKNFIGVGRVKIIATSGRETATYDVELNVRNPNPPVTRILTKELAPGETWQINYSQLGMTGTNKSSLEASSIPSLNLAKRLNYLIGYPHGCVEQTTSSVFPQLYLADLVSLSPQERARTERNIKAGINRLTGFQLGNGGLAYWPGSGEADEWGTNYAGHFMSSAQAKGYPVPTGFISQLKRFLKQRSLAWQPDTRKLYADDLVQAYRLYVLARAGSPELGAMNRLKEFQYLSVEAKWRLAAAYKLAGQPEVANRMVASLATRIKPYRQLFGTYGSDVRDEAMILETLTLLGQRARASSVLQHVAQQLSQDTWYSTQTTAYSLLAVAEYCGANKTGSKLSVSYQAGSQKGTVNSNSYVWQQELTSHTGKATLRNSGNRVLFVRLIQQGQPSSGQSNVSRINPSILQMSVSYTTLTGKPVNIAALKQGTDFLAQVTIKNPGKRGRYDNLALTQIFPSGWEILNTRMMSGEDAFNPSPADYRDIRDDRVNTYFALPEGKEVTYYVMLNAAYTGSYYLPGTYCEAMYDASINAFHKGQWVTVIR